MFERYTEKARRVIFFARYESSSFGSPYIESEHLLLGLLRENKALVYEMLRKGPGLVEEIRRKIESSTLVREKVSTSVDLPLSNESKRILAFAAEEAERASHRHIGTEHLLAGILREEQCFAATLLREAGLSLDDLRRRLKAAHHRPDPVPGIPAGSIAERVHPGHAEGCVEFLWGSTRVGITGLAAVGHIPRVGEEVVINDADLGLRSFRVKDVTYYYETDPPAAGAPQKLAKVIVQVEKSGAPGETALYEST